MAGAACARNAQGRERRERSPPPPPSGGVFEGRASRPSAPRRPSVLPPPPLGRPPPLSPPSALPPPHRRGSGPKLPLRRGTAGGRSSPAALLRAGGRQRAALRHSAPGRRPCPRLLLLAPGTEAEVRAAVPAAGSCSRSATRMLQVIAGDLQIKTGQAAAPGLPLAPKSRS